jgi:hypothetical protein
MIPDQYVWLMWSSASLLPWVAAYAVFPQQRKAMVWTSLITAPFGLTEPLFVPAYWSPPSLFDLARTTGFDIESLIFAFGIGGVAAVLYNLLNPIYPAIAAMVLGAVAAMWCRPDLARKTWLGAILFVAYYTVFLAGLEWTAPGYIERVWNLDALSGVRIAGIPIEELLFAAAFGAYWSGLYEHFTWQRLSRPPAGS